MLTMLAVALTVLTSATALQAREAYAAGSGRGLGLWLVASLSLLIMAIALVWVLAREPKLLWWVPPTGFGVDWRCQENVPQWARVCFRP